MSSHPLPHRRAGRAGPVVVLALALAALAGTWLAVRPERHAPVPGLERRPESKAYLGLPPVPEFGSEMRWTTVPAFPNVTFRNPVVLEAEPGTDRLFVGELEGLLVAIAGRDPATSRREVVLDLTRQTQGGFDSGLLGLAFHPEYGRDGSPNRDFVYLFYSYHPQPVMVGRPEPETVTWSRVARFTMDRATGKLRPESEQVLIDQRKRIIFHVGGPMFFHPRDGFLYIAVGDEGGQQDSLGNSQRIDLNLFAGVLRIDVDRRGGSVSHPIRRQPADGKTAHYYIPSDNPFVGRPGVLEEFYAIGLRSPHRMTYDAVEDLAWIGEIGQASREEIEVLQIGRAPQNFQWAVQEGSRKGFKPAPAEPLGIWTDAAWEYGRDMGRSVIGGYVYRGQRHPALRGKYICADFANGRVWALTYGRENGAVKVTRVEHLATGEGFRNYHGGAGGITSFGLDHAGELLVLRHGPATRIERLAEAEPKRGNMPLRLSETGIFASLAPLQPSADLVPYAVNVPQWLNGATAQRWVALPAGAAVAFHPTERWAFPPGTVFVQHLEWQRNPADAATRRAIETRLLVVQEGGGAYGVTYRWRPDGREADLVTLDDVSETLETRGPAGERVRVLWVYPSPKNCLQCHTPGAGHVLGANARQLARPHAYGTGAPASQLAAWRGLGWLAGPVRDRELAAVVPLAAPDDAAATPEWRVRSYLQANCAHCHGATAIPSAWNGRIDVPLPQQGLIRGPVLSHRPGDGVFVIAPGDPAKSELFQRVSENVIGKRMPPLSADRVDTAFVTVLRDWIGQLPREGAR